MRLFPYVTVLVILFSCTTLAQTEELNTDEEVIFYPTYGSLKDGLWKFRVYGVIFEKETDSSLREFVVNRLRPDDLNDPKEIANFERRSRLFMIDHQRGKQISIRVLGTRKEAMIQKLDPTEGNGLFHGWFTVQPNEVSPGIKELKTELITENPNLRSRSGKVKLLNERGMIVISDIDDTIKISDVRNKEELLKNTFIRDFKTPTGMPKYFKRLEDAGAQFIYVSASPWQLYSELQSFCYKAKYPAGIFVMKPFRMKDSEFFDLFKDPFDYKISSIEPILEDFPNSKFILVGDSGEKDPEAYVELAKRYPKQIERILIRVVYGKEQQRFATLKEAANGKLEFFDNPAKLK